MCITILIPLYNEQSRVGRSLEKWKETGLFHKFPVVLIDDGSNDETLRILQQSVAELERPREHTWSRPNRWENPKACSPVPRIRALSLSPHRSKLAAIGAAMAHVETDFVICLDADTWFPGCPQELMTECERLIAHDVDVVAFRLEPRGTNASPVVALQEAEYAFFTDAARRIFRIVGNVNGAASLWRSSCLRTVLLEHTGVFEGDDLEATLLALRQRARVVASSLTFYKQAKPSFFSLARQRIQVWDIGLFDILARCPPFRLPLTSDGLFFRWYFLFEAVLHPVKLLSFLILLGSFFSSHWTLLALAARGVLAVYLSASFVALALWIHAGLKGRVGLRMGGVLLMLFLYPTYHLWLGQDSLGFLAYYGWWCVVSVAYSLALTDRRSRIKALLISPCMPVYFFFITVGFRTVGMLLWGFRLTARKAPVEGYVSFRWVEGEQLVAGTSCLARQALGQSS